MFENIMKIFKRLNKKEEKELNNSSRDAAKERLHLVLMQDRANVSADFLELMKQEIIEVIKKYIDVDEKSIDVRLTNKENEDGTNGAPALYANIPIINIKNEARKVETKEKNDEKREEKVKNSEKTEKIEKMEEVEQLEKVKENEKTEKMEEIEESKEKEKEEKIKKIENERIAKVILEGGLYNLEKNDKKTETKKDNKKKIDEIVDDRKGEKEKIIEETSQNEEKLENKDTKEESKSEN